MSSSMYVYTCIYIHNIHTYLIFSLLINNDYLHLVQIYTDDETDLALQRIRQLEPNFNMAAFFKTCVMEKIQFGDKLDRVAIQRNIVEAKSRRDLIDGHLAYLMAKDKQAEVQELEAQRKLNDEKDKQEKEAKKTAEAKRMLNEMFFDVVGRNMTDDEYLEYKTGSYRNFNVYLDKFVEAHTTHD